MTNDTHTKARLGLILAVAIIGAAGCGRCGAEPDAPSVTEVPESGDGFQAFGAEGSAEAPEEPQRPRIVHETPPTPGDFTVAPVTGDWATFRGDQTRSGLREVRAIVEPRIAWSIGVGIQGYANSPVVTSDGLFVSSQGDTHNGPDERDGVYSIDPATGAIRWFSPTERDANGLAYAAGVLVAAADSGKLYAFDATTGTELWVVDVECPVFHAPVIADGKIRLIRHESYATIDLQTGEIDGGELAECRRSERGALSYVDGVFYRTGEREQPRAHDAEGLMWTAEPPAENVRVRGRWMPHLVTRSMLIEAVHRWPYAVDDGGYNYRPAALARWADNGEVVWTADVNDPAHANSEGDDGRTAFLRSLPWVAGDRVFWTPTTAAELVAFDIMTGERVDAVTLPDCRSRAFGSIVGTPEMGYYARHDGLLYGFRTNPLSIAWQLSLGLHGATGGDESHLPVLGVCSSLPRNGTALFSAGSIAPDGTLYIGSGDGWLYAIRDASWE